MGTYRRRPLLCPVERCRQAFHDDEQSAAATHAAAAHTICSCGWVGLGFARHQARTGDHRRVAVARWKGGPVASVTPIRREMKTTSAPMPEPGPTLAEAEEIVYRLDSVSFGILAHDLAEQLKDDDPLPRAWTQR